MKPQLGDFFSRNFLTGFLTVPVISKVRNSPFNDVKKFPTFFLSKLGKRTPRYFLATIS